MSRILLELSYVGSAYHGWQVQKNAASVQATVQGALSRLCCADVTVTGCSRTDAGVHARHYFALAQGEIPDSLRGARLLSALNVHLPSDVAAIGAYLVEEDFHPRYSVLSKTYEYVIYDGKYPDPFLEGRAWFSSRRLDHRLMNENAADLVGRYDFSAFCATGSKALENGDCVRNIFDASVTRNKDTVVFRVSADGFLYNMVRIMAGTLAEISFGRIEGGSIPKIIACGDRKLAGRTLPACGLYLDCVEYPKGVIREIE